MIGMIGKNSTTVTKRRTIRRATIAAAALTLAAVSVAVQSAGASTATTILVGHSYGGAVPAPGS